MSNNLVCQCICLLCQTYTHEYVNGSWWLFHGESCPESGTGTGP